MRRHWFAGVRLVDPLLDRSRSSCCSSSAIRRARCRRASGRCCRPPTAASCRWAKARDPYLERDALKISVFMNVFNVHSNRSPVDGTVREGRYHPGQFVNAELDKASTENERNAVAAAPRRAGRDLRAGGRPDRAAHPVLRQARATGCSAASATASSASVRASTSTCRWIAEPQVAIGDKVSATSTVLAELPPA